MNFCKISIILPVYNTAPYLKQCLESLIHQTLPEIEILAVNDGSTDESLSILREYAALDPRIQIFTTENRGVSAARNFGAARASGEYLWFVDSDDVTAPDACRRLYDCALQHSCDLVLFDRMDHDDSQNFTPGIRVAPNLPFSSGQTFCLKEHPDLLAKMKPFVWDKLIRREYWNQLAFPFPSDMRFEDLPAAFLLCAEASSITYLPEVCYHYRLSVGFLDKSTLHSQDLVRALLLLEQQLRKRSLWSLYRNAFTFLAIRHICYRFRHLLLDPAPGNLQNKLQTVDACFRYLNLHLPFWRFCPLLQKNLPISLREYWEIYSSKKHMKLILRHMEGLPAKEQSAFLLQMKQRYPFRRFRKSLFYFFRKRFLGK